jgi:hypothetical protein
MCAAQIGIMIMWETVFLWGLLMTGWEGWVQTFIAAGLGTAAVETFVAWWKDRNRKGDLASYIALRLAARLERFASGCLDLNSANEIAPRWRVRWLFWKIFLGTVG